MSWPTLLPKNTNNNLSAYQKNNHYCLLTKISISETPDQEQIPTRAEKIKASVRSQVYNFTRLLFTASAHTVLIVYSSDVPKRSKNQRKKIELPPSLWSTGPRDKRTFGAWLFLLYIFIARPVFWCLPLHSEPCRRNMIQQKK